MAVLGRREGSTAIAILGETRHTTPMCSRSALVLALVAALAGCLPATTPDAAGWDAAPLDDAGERADAGTQDEDAGNVDGADAGVTGDAGGADAGAGEGADAGTQADAGPDEPAVDIDADGTGIQHLRYHGVDLFAGVGGYYIIGSCTGADDANNNVTSQGSDGHTLLAPGTCPGAPFSLAVTGSNPYHVTISVGPLPVAYRTLSVPFDPVKVFIEEFAFDGDGYQVGCGTSFSPRAGSGARYDSIPLPCTIPGVGGVGVARVRPPPTWGEITGPVATVRRTFLAGSGEELAFINHPGTNNIELGFNSDFSTTIPQGTVVTMEEEILVSSPGTTWSERTSWSFEMEASAMGHGVGRAEADGWSADTNLDDTGMLAFGPYAPDLPADTYHALFRLLVDNNSADSLVVVHLDVSDFDGGGAVLAERDVRRSDFAGAMAYQDFSVPFSSPGVGHRLEFRVRWLDRAYVRADRVDAVRAP